MSNTICVKNFCRLSYEPFKREGGQLLALINRQWVIVEQTNRKNKYGDMIFIIKQ